MDFGITDILGAVVGAGTGWIGSLGNAAIGYYQAKLQFKHQETMATMQADSNDLASSYQHDAATYSQGSGSLLLQAIDFLRGSVRPVVTYGLVGTLVAIYFTSSEADEKQAIVQSVIYLSCLSLTWWFADKRRMMQVPMMQLSSKR